VRKIDFFLGVGYGGIIKEYKIMRGSSYMDYCKKLTLWQIK
jgi:hypothetical protein